MIINSSNEQKNSINTDEESVPKAAGADEMMPIIVYCLIQGNIRKIKSNLNFIRLFRHHTMFDSNKEEYFTTVLQSAVEYIDNLNEEFASKGLMVSPGYWCYACVASSCYYISYATSLLESVQFLTMSINDAKKAYVDFCLDNITTGSVAKWKKAGLTSPFEQQTIDKLVNYCNAM